MRSAMIICSAVLLALPTGIPAETPGIQVTVYNEDLAIVKDVREMELPEGEGMVQFREVATRIDPTSVHFESLTDADNTVVLEQNYEYDLVNSSKLLEKFVDREILITQRQGQAFGGKLLSHSNDQLVIKDDEDRIQIVAREENIDRIELEKLPEGLITRPTLVWKTSAATGGKHLCKVTYMTGGMSWKANYVMVINPDDTQINWDGWVTLDNQSGATYQDAKLKLVAGEVNRVRADNRGYDMLMESQPRLAKVAAAPPQFEEKSFFEYHLYTLGRPTTIKQAQTKQVSLLSAQQVPVDKVFEYDGARNDKSVEVKLEFKNSEERNMGMPLPKGVVRAYKADSDGSLEFIGEDQLDHTPRNEEISIKMGNAFDVVGERNREDHRRLSDRTHEDTYKIVLRNHKKEDIQVKVVEHVHGDWKMMESTHKHIKKDQNTLHFLVNVPAEGETELRYRIRVTW